MIRRMGRQIFIDQFPKKGYIFVGVNDFGIFVLPEKVKLETQVQYKGENYVK
ncbi:MAG: hypothetical protein ACYS1A_12540 [Planctomycetota bacterium]|jgi:hypothetical protein